MLIDLMHLELILGTIWNCFRTSLRTDNKQEKVATDIIYLKLHAWSEVEQPRCPRWAGLAPSSGELGALQGGLGVLKLLL